MIFIFFAVAISVSLAPGEKKDTGSEIADTTHTSQTIDPSYGNDTGVTARFRDFPSIHPLIVHFAISFILIAALMQIVNIFLLKREVAWMILGILLIGLVAAYLASSGFHPHTHGISRHAKLVLEQHDQWAEQTNFSAMVALIAQLAYMFFIEIRKKRNTLNIAQKTNRILTLIIALIMNFSAYSVLNAGHYGAQLVHIEGIGPQGKYLETEDED
jgi:uncharacterized membrane protein